MKRKESKMESRLLVKPEISELMFMKFVNDELRNAFAMGIDFMPIMLREIGIDDENYNKKMVEKVKTEYNELLKERQHEFLDFYWNMTTMNEAIQDSVMEKLSEEDLRVWYNHRTNWIEARKKEFPEHAKYIK